MEKNTPRDSMITNFNFPEFFNPLLKNRMGIKEKRRWKKFFHSPKYQSAHTHFCSQARSHINRLQLIPEQYFHGEKYKEMKNPQPTTLPLRKEEQKCAGTIALLFLCPLFLLSSLSCSPFIPRFIKNRNHRIEEERKYLECAILFFPLWWKGKNDRTSDRDDSFCRSINLMAFVLCWSWLENEAAKVTIGLSFPDFVLALSKSFPLFERSVKERLLQKSVSRRMVFKNGHWLQRLWFESLSISH